MWLTLRHKELHLRYARYPVEDDKKDHAEVANELNKRFSTRHGRAHRDHDEQIDEDHQHLFLSLSY